MPYHEQEKEDIHRKQRGDGSVGFRRGRCPSFHAAPGRERKDDGPCGTEQPLRRVPLGFTKRSIPGSYFGQPRAGEEDSERYNRRNNNRDRHNLYVCAPRLGASGFTNLLTFAENS